MQTPDERQVLDVKSKHPTSELLFLALNDYDEFERALQLRAQDSQRRAFDDVKTALRPLRLFGVRSLKKLLERLQF